MPELAVNGGFSEYHRFCNFVDKMQPIQKQCYHVNSTKNKVDQQLYNVGEEVLYKNNDHIETGVIGNVTLSKEQNNRKQYHITFRDNRQILAHFDNIQAKDETDVATVPIENKDYAEEIKFLNAT